MIHRADELTILNVIWAPQMSIYPHDHRTWAVIGIYGGQEDNTFYRRRKDEPGLDQVNALAHRSTRRSASALTPSTPSTNPRRKFTGAIHVYGGDFFAIQRSEWKARPSVVPWKRGGATPTITTVCPLTRRRLPIADGRPPKCVRQ